MATWQKLQTLLPNYVTTIYDDLFPVEVRHFLSLWLESSNWSALEPNDPSHENAIKEFIVSFINEISKAIDSYNPADVPKVKLLGMIAVYQEKYKEGAVPLFRHIKNILTKEMNILNEQVANFQLYNNPPMNPTKNLYQSCNAEDVISRISVIIAETQKIEDLVREYRMVAEQFRLILTQFKVLQERYGSNLVNGNRSNTTQTHFQMINNNRQAGSSSYPPSEQQLIPPPEVEEAYNLVSDRQTLIINTLRAIYNTISLLLVSYVDKELIGWKRKQQLAGNGCELDYNFLDTLQSWYEPISGALWKILTFLKEIKLITQPLSIPPADMTAVLASLVEISEKFTKTLTDLLLNTFIIERQPPQVMKTNTRFTTKVRFLVGPHLNLHLNPPVVKCTIISEAQANVLLVEKQVPAEGCGEIMNCTGTMEYDSTTKQLSQTFRNMQLKKIKRAEKKGSESVVDEKFALFFNVRFNVGEGNGGTTSQIQVWTMSLPVTVIVHGNQEPHAWATITWDNAFAEPGRRPFAVPERVPWGKVSMALNAKFQAATGKELSSDNLKFLAEKLFRSHYPNGDDFDTMQVSFSLFSKETLAERGFTFWDWFFAVTKLTREHLKPLWMDGIIHGFFKKKETENILSNCPVGTFLLRFSDSELGGITIASVSPGILPDEPKRVLMLHPFTARDFAIRSLPDRIFDLPHLITLYPDRPKEVAFARHYNPAPPPLHTSSTTYIKPYLMTTIPGEIFTSPPSVVSWSTKKDDGRRRNGYNSNPNTPNDLSESPDTPSTMSEPIAGAGWSTDFPAMEYDQMGEFPELAPFDEVTFQNVQARSHNY